MEKGIILKDTSYLRINGVEGFLLDLFNKEIDIQPENLTEVKKFLSRGHELKPVDQLNFLTDWIHCRNGKKPTVEYIYEGVWYELDTGFLTIEIND